MDVVGIFVLSFGGCFLSLGAWYVRSLSRTEVRTMFGTWTRADSPAAYWSWAVFHVLGLTLVIVVAAATTLYFIVDALA